MIPGLFGPPGRQLFGIYHPPTGPDRRTGVVLCYPCVQEYEHVHWPFRKLAAQLARAGFHVMRFDYWGTGDSSGELEDATPAAWRADITSAVQELKELSGVRTVSLVGLRLGASLALQAANELTDVSGVLLWNPVVKGVIHLRELEQLEEKRRSWSRQPTPREPNVLLGYPLAPEARRQVEALDLLGEKPVFKGGVNLVSTVDLPEQRQLVAQLRDAACSVEMKLVQAEPADALGDGAIRALVADLVERAV